MKRHLLILICLPVIMLLSGCNQSNTLSNPLESSLKEGVYINSFNGTTEWDSTPLATVYPVSSEKDSIHKLTNIWFLQDFGEAIAGDSSNRYLIKIVKSYEDKTISKPKIVLDQLLIRKNNISKVFSGDTNLLEYFLGPNTNVAEYDVALYIPTGYKLPDYILKLIR